jgi:ribulose-phosphate 3-epimerase
MSVNPGFGGQRFIPNSIKKIRQLKDKIDNNNYRCEIEVDGGVDASNIRELSEAGAEMFVCGSSIFDSDDKSKAVKKMKSVIS